MGSTFYVVMERDRHPTVYGPNGFGWIMPWNKGEAIGTGGLAECIANNMSEVYDEVAKIAADRGVALMAARRRLEALKASMGDKMPVGAHAALTIIRDAMTAETLSAVSEGESA